MATPAEDEGGRQTPKGAGGTNAFTRKLGPLPVWAWMGVGLGIALAYSSYKKNKAAQQQVPATSATGVQQTAGQTPPIIIQNYPGEGGTQGPAGPTGPAGPPGQPGAPGAPGTPTPPTGLPPIIPHPIPAPKPPPNKGGGGRKYMEYVVQPGDTLSGIANKFHVRGGWQTLWNFNTGSSSPHSKQAIATMKQRGPNLLYHGETIYIPQ